MDLKEFTSPLPKPWLTINADSTNVVTSVSSRRLLTAPLTLVPGDASAVTLTPAQMAGIVVIQVGRTANIGIPLSAAIDAYLGSEFAVNGATLQMSVINREGTAINSFTSAEIAAQPIPKAQSPAPFPATYTEFFFTRIAGIWTPLNS